MGKNALKRDFMKGDYIYVIDYWGTNDGTKAIETKAKITRVNYEDDYFWAVLYSDVYHRYKFSDYGRLFFENISEAIYAAERLPKPKTKVYVKIGNRFYRMTVLGINGMNMIDGYELYMSFRTRNISIDEIGHTVFLTKEDADNS